MDHAYPLARNSFMAVIHLIANVHTFEHGALLLFPVSPPQTFLAKELMESEDCDILILDEINVALAYNFLPI
jgi:hypothetical protein